MSERSYELLDGISDGFVAHDPQGRFRYVNARAGEMLGRDPAALIGTDAWSQFPESIGGEFHRACQRAIREQVSITMEEYFEPWERWFESRIYPSPAGLSIFFSDITERRAHARLLAESEARAQRLAERMRAVAEAASAVLGARTIEGLDAVIRAACLRVLPHDAFTFGIYEEADHALRFLDGWDSGVAEPGGIFPLEGTPSERVVRDRRPLITGRADEPAARGAAAFGTGRRSESTLRTAILSGSRVLGVLSVQSYTRDLYTPDDADVLDAFGAIVASAMENIELLEDRARAEARLRESEERYRAVFEHAPLGIAEGWMDGTGFVTNPALRRMLGVEERVTAEDIARITHPDDLALDLRHLEEVIAGTRDHYELEKRFRRDDGRQLWGILHVTAVRGRDGAPDYAFSILEDITERKVAEAALRQSEERFRRLVEGAPDPIVAHDLDGRYVSVNAAACALWGYTEEEMLTSVRAHHVDPACTPEALRELWPALKERGAVGAEVETVRRDGSRIPVEVRAVALDLDPPLVVGIVRDVSARRQLEEQLRQAQKMEAVGQLAGGVAHDFNNMLQAVGGFAAFLAEEVEPGSEAAEYVDEIRKAASRAADLTRQLLAFGRRQLLQLQLVDMNELVRDAERMLRRLIPENVVIETRLDPGAGRVLADPTQMHQVLLNLAVNARDAMPAGGRLVIRTGHRTVAADGSRRPPVEPGEYVELVVEDDGSGMDAETLAHAFEPFFTRKPQGEGTGLGLSTVEGVVSQSGGCVWAESDPGAGSAFTILLPRRDGPGDGESEPARAAGGQRVCGSGTVLLAEDEETVRRLARLSLEKAGYTVLEAADGEDALRVYAGQGRPIDLLVTDLIMPRLGGLELASRLREIQPGLRVLLISGYAGDSAASEGGLPPGTAFLQKPFLPETLSAVLARLAGGSDP